MGQRPMRERQCRFLSEITISKPFWTITGREGDDDDKKRDDGTGSGSSSTDDDTTDGTGDSTGTTSTTPATVSLEDYQKLEARMKAADQNRTAAEARVKEFEDKDRSELERAQNDLKEAKEVQKKLETALDRSRIHNKFLASNKHTWHDPETALALLDMSEVKVEDDGKVTGLEDAIEALAKAKPFLIKSDDGDGKDKDKNKKDKDGANKDGKPSGSQPPANGSNGSRDTDRKRLEEKYPQLTRQR